MLGQDLRRVFQARDHAIGLKARALEGGGAESDGSQQPDSVGAGSDRLIAAYERSLHRLLVSAERARAGVLALHLGPVALKAAAACALAEVRDSSAERPCDLSTEDEVIGCADAARLISLLGHLWLLATLNRPGETLRIDVEAAPNAGCIRLGGLTALSSAELAAITELVGAMGGAVSMDGAGSLSLILRGLPCGGQLRRPA